MEAKPESDDQVKESGSKTKMVVLKSLSNGKAEVSFYESDDDGELVISLDKGKHLSTKAFETMPKRMEFFFEKGFKA